jgi:hypothetical protein
MLWQLRNFYKDESGLVEKIVTLGLVIIIAGGILVAILGFLPGIQAAIRSFICANIPGAC